MMMQSKKISFDFDGTLVDDFYGELNDKKDEIQKTCRDLIDMGHEVHIVTKRFDEANKNYGKKNEHVEVFELAEKLGIKKENVYFTNREWKYNKLKALGINVHFENSKNEVDQIRTYTPHITVVDVEDPYWRNLKY
jgi:FMN phosphatase YigB (HAD superfamily)